MDARQSFEQRDARETGQVVLIGLLSGALYAFVYFAQRAIFLNGRTLPAGDKLLGVPADRAHLFWEYAGYGLATIALFALYWRLLMVCRRSGGLRDRRSRSLALLFPVLFNVGLLLGRPYLSTDVFSYMAQGYLGITPGRNPYTFPVRDVAGTPFAAQIVPWGWKPETHDVSPYGPVWTQLEIAAAHLTHISVEMLFLKSVVVAASLLSAVLIWLILGRVRPQDRLLGTLIYLWNPVAIVEFAGEGHNDALMIACVLLAILLAVQARPAGAIISLILGILTKYLPVLLLPAHLVYLWRTRRNWRHLALQLFFGLAGGLVLAVLVYRSLWVGAATFQGVRGQGQARFIASTSMALFSYLRPSHSEAEAARWTSWIVSGLFGLYLLIASVSVRDAASLLKACARITLVYLLVASPAYWPWYAALPLALMALSPHGSFFWMSLVLTFCSRLVAPMSDITVNGFTSWSIEVWSTTIAGLLLPLLVFVVLAAQQWWRRPERMDPLPST